MAKNTKKAKSLLLVCLLLVFGFACTSKPQSESELQVIEFKNLILSTSTNRDFSIAGDDLIITIEEEYVSMIYIFTEEVHDAVTDNELLKTQTMLKSRIIPSREFDSTDINFDNEIIKTIAGQQAFANSFYGVIDGITWFTTILAFNDGEFFYTIIFVCKPDSEHLSEYESEFAEFIKSIRFR